MNKLKNKLKKCWQQLSLGTKGMIVILLPLLILLASLVNLYQRELAAQVAENDLQVAIKNLAEIESIHAQLAEAATGVRGYLLTSRDDFLNRYYLARKLLPSTINNLRKTLADKQQEQLLDEMQPLVTKKLTGLETLVASGAFMPKNELTTFLVSQKKILDTIRSQIDNLKSREILLIKQKQQHLQAVRTRNLEFTLLTSVLVVLSTFVAAWLYNATIVKRVYALRDNADKLVKSQIIRNADHHKDELGELAQRLQESSELILAKQREVEIAHDEAINASHAKSIFLSRTSHELRTPLNAILGFAQLLESELIDLQQKNNANHIVVAGQHLLKLINEVLDIARIESGDTSTNIQAVALKPIIQEAITYVQHMAAAKNVRIEDLTDPDIHVLADSKKLLQVILNLISNAVKYGPANKPVTVWVSTEANMLTLFVKDLGDGIPQHLHHRIFTPFDRLGAESTPIEGTGLGLSLSKNIIESLGGQMGFLAHESTFWFTCPMAQSHQHTPSAPTKTAETTSKATSNKHILYVEDNPSNIALFEAMMRRLQGITFTSIGTCTDAKAYLEQKNIDLLLLDLQLPDGSGETLIATMKAMPQHQHVPILVLTADATAETEARITQLGITHYFTKPLNVKALTEALTLHLTSKDAS